MRFKAIKKLIASILVAGSIGVSMTALADTNISVTYVPITGSVFVVDSLHGVDAMYKSSSKLLCIELVQRYYKQIYGISISTGYGGPKTHSSSYYFVETSNPKPGDVAYSPSYKRAAGYAHWALVKDYDPATGVVTFIEQNWKWAGKAAYERKVSINTGEYFYYTLVGLEPLTDIAESDSFYDPDPTTPSDWAQDMVELAEKNGIVCTEGYRENITREEFCEIVLDGFELMVDEPDTVCEEMEFSDCDDESVSKCVQYGLVTGVSTTSFMPDEYVTRETAAVVLHRIMMAMDSETPESGETSDLAGVSSWAVKSVSLLRDEGIMTGVGSSIGAKDYITNEQAIVMMMRLLNLYY